MGLQPSTAWLGEWGWGKEKAPSWLAGSSEERRGRDQRCLQPGDRQAAGGERGARGCLAFPRPLRRHPLPADTVSVFQVSE